MHTDVLVKICLLRECLVTPALVANERTFSGVRAQVVEEVVPLPKDVFTLLEVALHQLDPPVGSRVLKSHHSEASRSRHVVSIDSDLADVDLASVFDVDCDSAGNHILQRPKFDLARITCERLEYHFLSLLSILTFRIPH